MTQQQSQIDSNTDKLPDLLPVLPLFDTALFPKMVLPLVVMQGASVKLVDEAMAKDRIVGLLASKKTKPGG
jgi:ATP-dependent Lon protease